MSYEKEHIPIKVWRFPLRDSADEDCVFAGLKKLFACLKVSKFQLSEFLQSEIMQKSCSAQNIANIVAVTDEFVVPPDFLIQINNFFK